MPLMIRKLKYMTFNDTTTKNGAIQKCEDWLFGGDYGAISSNANLLLKFTNLINSGLDKTKALLYTADGRWQDDDPNYTTLPEDTTNLSNGVADYQLGRDHVFIQGFEVMDSAGKYYPIYPIDYSDIREIESSETGYASNPGIPSKYDLKGDIVTLYPAPATGSVTMTAGLKVIYKRESDYFESTDTTKEMGIPRMFHDIPCLFACSEYSKMNIMKDKARELDAEIIKRSLELKAHYSSRNIDDTPVLESEVVYSK